jgi:GTPase SAR1 family protein
MGMTKRPEQTIGIDRYVIPLDDYLSVVVWDCSGREMYRQLVPSYSGTIDAVIAVYDVSKRATFGSKLLEWVTDARMHARDVPVLIVGLKTDKRGMIKKSPDHVTTQEGKAFAEEHGFHFFETSIRKKDDRELKIHILGSLKNLIQDRDFKKVQMLYEISFGKITYR